jgi:hypothetical protein
VIVTLATRHRLRVTAAIGVTFVALLVLADRLFGSLRHAELRLIDDHEIVRFLGVDHSLALAEIPDVLAGTEVGAWGHGTRLRPVYFLFRLLETTWWGDDMALWYTARLVAVAIVGATVAFLLLRALTTPETKLGRFAALAAAAFGFGVATVLLPAWGDIASRLGPSEIYVALGLVPFTIGAIDVWREPSRRHGWILLLVGYLVIVGSKEDGILLALPLALLLWLKFRDAGRPFLLWTVTAISAIATAYIVLGIGLGLAGAGGDTYGESRSISGFVETIPANAYLFAIVAVLAVFLIRALRAGRTPDAARGIRSMVAAHGAIVFCGVLTLIALGDLLVYQNFVFDGRFAPDRYGILSQLAVVAAFGVLTVLAAQVATSRRLRVALPIILAVAIVLSPVGAGLYAAGDIRAASSFAASDSRALAAGLAAGVSELTSTKDSQAVLVIDRALDYERVYSVPQFVEYLGGPSRMILVTELDSAATKGNDLSSELARQLVTMAGEGNTEAGWRVLPSNDLDPSEPVICFVFTPSAAAAEECDSVHVLN